MKCKKRSEKGVARVIVKKRREKNKQKNNLALDTFRQLCQHSEERYVKKILATPDNDGGYSIQPRLCVLRDSAGGIGRLIICQAGDVHYYLGEDCYGACKREMEAVCLTYNYPRSPLTKRNSHRWYHMAQRGIFFLAQIDNSQGVWSPVLWHGATVTLMDRITAYRLFILRFLAYIKQEKMAADLGFDSMLEILMLICATPRYWMPGRALFGFCTWPNCIPFFSEQANALAVVIAALKSYINEYILCKLDHGLCNRKPCLVEAELVQHLTGAWPTP